VVVLGSEGHDCWKVKMFSRSPDIESNTIGRFFSVRVTKNHTKCYVSCVLSSIV